MIRVNWFFSIKDSEFRDFIFIKIKKSLDKPMKDKDGKPVKYIEKEIKTRCKVKFVYAREIDVTEKTTASHLMDFYVRDRKALRDLDTKGSIVYDGKVYNIKYVNPINTLLEIRGQYVGEAKN